MAVKECRNGHEASTDRKQPTEPIKFTDWRGGKGVAEKDENDSDEEYLISLTLTAANWTDLKPEEGRLPGDFTTIKGDNLWERLANQNRDCAWRYRDELENSARVDRQYKHTLLAAFCGQLELNRLQREIAYLQLVELDVPRTGLSLALNAFIICALVVNEDARRYGGENVYHPQRNPENNDSDFQRLEERLIESFPRITKTALTSVYNKLSQGERPRRDPSRWKPYIRHRTLAEKNPSGPPAEWPLAVIQRGGE